MTEQELERAAMGCRGEVEELMHRSRKECFYGTEDRAMMLAEAQVYATLALAYSTAAANAARVMA